MKDFSLKIYRELIALLKNRNYITQTLENFIKEPYDRVIILRHDVDRKPENALRMAKLENELEVKATYYFRTIPKTFKPEIIKQIADKGHEIGYHYENLSEVSKKKKDKGNKK